MILVDFTDPEATLVIGLLRDLHAYSRDETARAIAEDILENMRAAPADPHTSRGIALPVSPVRIMAVSPWVRVAFPGAPEWQLEPQVARDLAQALTLAAEQAEP